MIGFAIEDAKTLAAQHPPRCINSNKALAMRLSGLEKLQPSGTVLVTQWSEVEPQEADAGSWSTKVCETVDAYEYPGVCKNSEGQPVVEWHVNFADANLFFGYGGSLMAQDEIQVAEHPLLACIREKLRSKDNSSGIKAQTRDGKGNATPVLVSNVERRIRFCPVVFSKEHNRRVSLYGNAFARASPALVTKACQVTERSPMPKSNIIAMAALGYGRGLYSETQLKDMLVTAYTSFAAAVRHSRWTLESDADKLSELVNAEASDDDTKEEEAARAAECHIHTGNWGCGAFGGRVHVMALIQLIAANMAGVDRLFYHSFSQPSHVEFEAAVALFEKLRASIAKQPNSRCALQFVLDFLVAQRFKWGVSNGT